MRKKSFERGWNTYPTGHEGVQVNTCKSVGCQNFGVSPYIDNSEIIEVTNKHHPFYTTSGKGKNEAAIICKACKENKAYFPRTQVSWVMKSNEAIVQESERFWRYLDKSVKCPNKGCFQDQEGRAIKKRGFTKKDTQR
ncbi:hypothetical protein M2G84_21570 [Vibrio vulnificus]|nr:hypothetical protein [Vibrio vulnificus]